MFVVGTDYLVTEAEQAIEFARTRPVDWAAEILGFEGWPKQDQILAALSTTPRVAVRSANAVGKTKIAAVAALNFLCSHIECYVIVTSSSWYNIKHIFWPEFRYIIANAKIPIAGRGKTPDPLKTEWEPGKPGDRWAIYSISTKQVETFGGYHNKAIMVIVDEASALETDIMDAIHGITTGDDDRILLIGNPLRTEGAFFDAFYKEADLWKKFAISAFESPNVVEGKSVIPGLATQGWIDTRKKSWGEESPIYQARVKGNFPTQGSDAVVPFNALQNALAREHTPAGARSMGTDVAEKGPDNTFHTIGDDNGIIALIQDPKQETMVTTGRVIQVAKEYGVAPERVSVDVTGLGAGVGSRLHEQGFMCQRVNFACNAINTEEYANIGSELWFGLRERIVNQDNFSLPADSPHIDRLVAELSSRKYGPDSGGRIILENKKQFRTHYGRSPDAGDSAGLCYHEPAEAGFIIDAELY